MDFNELAAAAAVDLFGSYGRAAKDMEVPVSTVSKRVTRLEDELGVKLFNRTSINASVTLTEAGKQLMPIINQLLSTNRFMRYHIDSVKGTGSNRIAVGSTTTLIDKGDGRIIAEFVHDHPEANVITVVRSQNEVTRFLIEGRIDCAFLMMPGDESSLTDIWETFSGGRFDTITLRSSDTMHVMMSKKDPLTQSEEVSIDNLKYHRIVFREWDNKGSNAGKVNFFKALGVDDEDYDVGYENFINPNYVFDLIRLGTCVVPQTFPLKNPPEGITYVKLKGWQSTHSILFVVRKLRMGMLDEFVRYVERAAKQWG